MIRDFQQLEVRSLLYKQLDSDSFLFPKKKGIRRRGLTIEALRQYMLAQGPSQAQLTLEWDNIWTTNKRIIDPIAPRHSAVLKDNLYVSLHHSLDRTGIQVLSESK